MSDAFDLDRHGWLDLGPGWLFTSIRDAVLVVDAETARIALWNPAASDLLGVTEGEAIGMSLWDVFEDLRHMPQWPAACSDGNPRQTVELFAHCKNGPDVCAELTLGRLEKML